LRVERISVFGKACGDMRVMMLHFEQGQSVPLRLGAREFRRQILRVAVDDQRRRGMIEELPEKREGVAVIVERRRVFKVTLMLRQDCLTVLDKAERRLELATHGQEVGGALEAGGKLDGGWREATGAPKQARLSVHDAHDRIIHSIGDRAVVHDGIGRNAAETAASVVIVDDGGFF
jgi:hypothetical protein